MQEPVPFADRPQRSGETRLEAQAVARVRAHVAEMPASLVVQLALWPDELARWARAERIAESVVYNLLARRKPYLRIRERLAARLGVPTGHLATLVDRPAAGGAGQGRPRDGGSPLERRAVAQVERELAALAAATVVGLAMWPETLTSWARAHGVQPSAVWATLAGAVSEPVATGLARRLGVTAREVVALVEAERLPAGRPERPPVPSEPAPADAAPAADPAPPARPAPPTRDQLSLGL
ncbi:hypothetical protein [Roseisolibacter sp. H3M3-2]|uniref:hypothetical protein n=1 Tax=Roseisolibacter sp. H3M3-2 TaxID=3031323 RepID=UPI0023DCBBE6|nr:hypothetical protein [Roseisolibacter sp. H3M3-2]MDF1505010.1 hypothetical protein [Roseisolibacter sp. H3M3-2]